MKSNCGYLKGYQEEFAPCASLRGSSTGVVARVGSLQGRMGESARQVDGLFESLLGRRLRRKSAPSRPSPNAEEHGIWGR